MPVTSTPLRFMLYASEAGVNSHYEESETDLIDPLLASSGMGSRREERRRKSRADCARSHTRRALPAQPTIIAPATNTASSPGTKDARLY